MKFKGVQLAKGTLSDFRDNQNYYIEPKIDGIRVIIDPHENKAYSRNYKPITNIPHILYELKKKVPSGYLVDGELFYDTWNKTMSMVQTKKNLRPPVELKLYAFDLIKKEEYNSGRFQQPYTERRRELIKLLGHGTTHIKVVPSSKVSNKEQAIQKGKEFITKGYEGGIIKPDTPYITSRKGWMKYKDKKEIGGKIVDVIEGKGKYKGTMGALIVDVNGVNVGIGSGFTDTQRNDIWKEYNKNKRNIIGKKIDLIYTEKTQKGSLRNPRAIRLRLDIK